MPKRKLGSAERHARRKKKKTSPHIINTRREMEIWKENGAKIFKDCIDFDNNFNDNALMFNKVDDKIGIEGLHKFKLSQKHFNSIKSLHNLILERVGEDNLKCWCSKNSTEYLHSKKPPTRCYAFLPHSKYESAYALARKGNVELFAVETMNEEGERESDRRANYASSVSLDFDDIDNGITEALMHIINTTKAKVALKYVDCISLNDVTTLQPNIANDTDYLKCHIDSPLNDGIGVVIVTIGISNEADIIISDENDKNHFYFHLNAGEFYVLSGPSRNIYSHGVLCEENNFGRESLNIRFGLHSRNKPGEKFDLKAEMPLFFFDDDEN